MLSAVLDQSRAYGFLGPGPVEAHVTHALGFARAWGDGAPPARALDLGSGGGVPGLVLAGEWPETEWVLLDANVRRTEFLVASVAELGLAGRVRVCRARAEEAGRQADLRGSFDLVTARGFGPPAVTAECAAPFLRIGGRLVVSEPPDAEDRWPADGLVSVGLVAVGRVAAGATFAVMEQREACPERYPRRVGIPAKRPLFG